MMSVLVKSQLKFQLVLQLLMNNNTVTVKGPKGELTRTFHPEMKLKLKRTY